LHRFADLMTTAFKPINELYQKKGRRLPCIQPNHKQSVVSEPVSYRLAVELNLSCIDHWENAYFLGLSSFFWRTGLTFFFSSDIRTITMKCTTIIMKVRKGREGVVI